MHVIYIQQYDHYMHMHDHACILFYIIIYRSFYMIATKIICIALSMPDWESPVHVTCSLRTYPLGFGHGLSDIMGSWQVQPRLRQKRPVNVNLSDRELFNALPLGDTWADAQLIDVYKYLRKSKKTMVPNTWVPVFEKLDSQIEM